MNYIYADNKKAVDFFKSNGFKLNLATKVDYINCWGNAIYAVNPYKTDFSKWRNSDDEDVCCAIPVYIVSMKCSGSAFHKFLKENGLLYKK